MCWGTAADAAEEIEQINGWVRKNPAITGSSTRAGTPAGTMVEHRHLGTDPARFPRAAQVSDHASLPAIRLLVEPERVRPGTGESQ
jgi:hypothetical protein